MTGRIGKAAMTGALVIGLSACQTTQIPSLSEVSSIFQAREEPGNPSGRRGKNLLPPVAFTPPTATSSDAFVTQRRSSNLEQATPNARHQGGIIDERSTTARSLRSGKGTLSGAEYGHIMRKLDPQLANAADLLVTFRGLMKNCSDRDLVRETEMDAFFEDLESVLGEVFNRAYAMEAKRLQAEGGEKDTAVIALLLTRHASLDARDKMLEATRKIEEEFGNGRKLSDDQRIELSCLLLSRKDERRVITRRISQPLLEYLLMMRHGHPAIFRGARGDEDLISGVRLLTHV